MIKPFLFLTAVSAFAYEAVLTDIEGTTTSISFVHDVLFPYAKQNAREFLSNHWDDPEVAGIVGEVKKIASSPDASQEEIAETLVRWMEEDKKHTPLKALQGMMWKDGYEQGDFQGHVYPDAYEKLSEWKQAGLALYVYSSGSVPAQKLLFSHTGFGDMTPLFSGYFDTKIGGKKEPASYAAIAKELNLDPKEVLFLSDLLDEIRAAQAAGMGTVLLCREGAAPSECPCETASDFNSVHPR